MIDLSTFRRIPWENNVPFFLVSFFDPETKTPLSVDPRGVLKRVVEIGQDLGYECYSGVEYEVGGCNYLSCAMAKSFIQYFNFKGGVHPYGLARAVTYFFTSRNCAIDSREELRES